MEYLNKLRETVSNVAASVSAVLPGNPIIREFEPVAHVASAGPGLTWKIYSGYKKSNGKEVSIWFFDKKVIEKWFKLDKEVTYDCMKRGVSQLTRLRHPHILTVEHPLEESRDTLAFCSEPVFASLANVLGRCDNMPAMLSAELSDFRLEEVEIRHGLSEVLKALNFLHSDIKVLHRNICAESVLITKRDCWKLAGFEFCVAGVTSSDKPVKEIALLVPSQVADMEVGRSELSKQGGLRLASLQSFLSKNATYPFVEWDEGLTPYAQPPLNYLAPEVVFAGRYDPAADIYSVGVLIYAIYNKGGAVNNYGNSLITYKKNEKQLKSPPLSVLRSIPDDLKEDLKMCLLFTPDLRPDAVQLAQVAYFSTEELKVLQQLESLCQFTIMEKVESLKLLDGYVAKFSKRLALWKLLSFLSLELEIQEMVPLVLPRILDIAKRLSEPEYCKFVLPLVLSTLSSSNSQVQSVLLSNIDFLFSSTPNAEAKDHLLPFLYAKLDSDVPPVLDSCLKAIPNICHLIDQTAMKTVVLPKLLHLATDVANISIKVNSLICLSKIIIHLESWMVVEQVIPTLSRVSSKEPGVLMSVLGIFLLAFQSPKLNLSKEVYAKYCLPFLVSASVEHSLNLKQFETFLSLIRQMLAKIENEQLRRLTPENDFNVTANAPAAARTKAPAELNGLQVPDVVDESPSNRPGAQLSLKDKKRLAQEQEKTMQLRAQPMLVPEVVTGPVHGVAVGDGGSNCSPGGAGFPCGPMDHSSLVGIPPPLSLIRNPVACPPPSTPSDFVRFATPSCVNAPFCANVPSPLNSLNSNWNGSLRPQQPAKRKVPPANDPFKDLVMF